MRRALLCILFLRSVTFAMTETSLVPPPRSIDLTGESFTIDAETVILIETGRRDLRARVFLLLDQLRGAGIVVPVTDAAGPLPGAIFIGSLAGAEPESYTLDIMPEGVVLRGGSADGVTWGLQTLRQLLPPGLETPYPRPVDDPGRPDGDLRALPPDCRYPVNNLRPAPGAPERSGPASASVVLPCLRLTDAPRFGWRGVLLDCCRHFTDIAAIERLLDLMSLHKLNRLHWHLTEDQGWRLEIKSRPRLAEVAAWRTDHDGVRYGGYYTQDEARHIVEYAARRGIIVVPEIEMPGHSQAALAAYPELGCRGDTLAVQDSWGVWPDVYCAGNEEVFAFLEEVLEEVLDIFPSRFIHIGGDECPKHRWRECPKCQRRITDEGLTDEHELQSWFVQRMERWLASRDRRLIGWDEILEGGLAAGATVQSWRGFEGAVAAAQQGHDTVVSPTSHAYFDYDIGGTDLAEVYAFEPVPAELSADEARHVLGGEMNLWTEYAPQAVQDERLFPRLCAMAEVLWSAPPPLAEKGGRDVSDPAVVGRDLSDFWARLQGHYERLDRLGVRRAGEGRPVTITAAWDGDRDGWLLAWEADWRRPAGKAEVRVTAGENIYVEDVSGTGFRRGEGPLSAQLWVDDRPFGAPQHISLVKNLALGAKVTVEPEPAEKYAPQVADPITDGVLPDGDYHDGRWLAWEGPDGLVTLDLGETREVRGASAVCLHAGGRLIYSPERVTFETSRNGRDWTELSTGTWRLPPEVMARVLRTYQVRADEAVKARYVRVRLEQRRQLPEWPWYHGQKPWIFLGQVGVE